MRQVFLATLLLCPTLVFGADFSSEALFLSKSPVQEGEVVLIHAVIQNDKPEKFEGDLRFSVAQKVIGTTPVSLESGEALTTSISWSPVAGEQTVVAQLVGADESVAASEEATFTIAEKPKPTVAGTSTASSTTTVESSAQIQSMIGGLSPAVADVAEPIFNTLDSWRQSGANFLDTQIANTKERLPKGGVLGAEEENVSDPMGTAARVFQTLYFYLLTLLHYLLSSAAVFYPLLAIALLYFLWRLYRRMSAR